MRVTMMIVRDAVLRGQVSTQHRRCKVQQLHGREEMWRGDAGPRRLLSIGSRRYFASCAFEGPS